MSQEKADSGTVILNENNEEIGVIKKIYTEKLARLELMNSESIALDLSLTKDVSSSGRLIKKKSAYVVPEFKSFLRGTSDIFTNLLIDNFELIIQHLETKETKKALQHYEYDIINKVDSGENLTFHEILGVVRGIELAGKNAQDFIIKMVFHATELKPELKEKLAPEMFVDKLNQEKAFYKILWNLLRIATMYVNRLKNSELVLAISEGFLEIGLKNIDYEYKEAISTNDLLYWNERIESCIFKYIALLINSLANETREYVSGLIKNQMIEELRKFKINNTLKEQTLKIIELFNYEDYNQMKTMELLHSGLKGFNLKVMSEKKAIIDFTQMILSFLHSKDAKNIINLQKEITKFTREIRDVSKEFMDILFEINQYLKKIEYGDSKVNDYYSDLQQKIIKRKYIDLSDTLNLLNKSYSKE
ncbi:MAG: hypothetical protein JXA54_14915 [Candidatus Heimdallarchaeota archaeon]|nr:hypothetical protein [Candidatus Heimdallarchaeota archaeon]